MKKLILAAIIILSAFLRFYKLAEVPPSLYWDEASLGYNAFSILKTGQDEHGKFLPLTNFAAFGDYKPPGYIYATALSIAVFGLNEFSIRFQSAFFGLLTVILTYLMAKKLFENEIIALSAAFFLAISPWHLQMSRAAFEANLGLFFSTLGIYLFVKFAKDNPLYIFPSAIAFLAAMYTFTGQRLFVPFILLILAIQFREQVLKNLKVVGVSILIAAILFWPLFKFTTKTIEGRLRFDEVTIFKNLKPIDDSIRFRQKDNFAWWSNILHNRRLFFAHEYLINYFDAFNPSFLFFKGDVNPRLSIQEIGQLYYFDFALVLFGLFFLFSKKHEYRYLIIGWLLISPLGPATARETPHALRMLHVLPTYQIIAALGFYQIIQLVKFNRAIISLVSIVIALNMFYYLHMYYLHYPIEFSGEWQYGYKQAVEICEKYYNEVDKIIVTKALARPYIYYLLYMNYDPPKYWQTRDIVKDRFFFYEVNAFDKIIFADNPSENLSDARTLLITASGNLPSSSDKIETIKDLKGKGVFDVGISN